MMDDREASGAEAVIGERLARQVAFVLEADALKRVQRRNPVGDGTRRENSAEHSWHLALMAMVLAEYAPADTDVGRVVAMLMVHDLVEIDAGDTFAYDAEAVGDQAEREREAADRLFAVLPADQAQAYRALWEEFDRGATREARFAIAIDRLAPMLLNFQSGGGTWSLPQVRADDVLERAASIADGAVELWTFARELVAEGRRRGYFAESHR